MNQANDPDPSDGLDLDEDLQRIIAQATQESVERHSVSEGGGLMPWTQRTADQFKQYLETPEGIETLICDPYFLGLGEYVYPSVMDDIIELFETRRRRPVNLVIFLEGIGSGKTTKFSILQFLQWFELSMNPDPQAFYRMAPGSIIALINLSRTESQARRVAFGEVWRRFQCPFVRDYFTPNPRFSKEIQIPQNNTIIFAGTSSAMSALGYNLYGGGIDEACFLEVVEDSKRAANQERYDAAEEIYNAVWDRMTSRFMRGGIVPGMLVMFSSPRYPEDFLERKIRQALELGDDSGIFFRRRSTWSAKGKAFFPSNEFFFVDVDTLDEVTEGDAISSGDLIFLDNDALPPQYDSMVQAGRLIAQKTDRGVKLVPTRPSGAPHATDLEKRVNLLKFEKRLRALKKIT